ncbi:MAG: hypothetical protein KJ630_06030 [Proteobacteria bacterium]|nr:hypothetical protein [Pseudomonadota bacterium]
MAYSYLLDLYQVLAERQEKILKTCVAAEATSTEEHFKQGRLAATNDFLAFLKDNYHAKLPRRLQKE